MRIITLPDWNDLPEPVRMAVCAEARFWDDNIGGDMAVNVYRKLKEQLDGLNLDRPDDEPLLFEEEPLNDRLLTIHDVAKLTSLGKRTIYDAMKRRDFPVQVHLSNGRVAWSQREVQGWIRRRTRARPAPGIAPE